MTIELRELSHLWYRDDWSWNPEDAFSTHLLPG
jgi:hypothetical protein